MSNKKYFFQAYQSYLSLSFFYQKLEEVYELRRVFRKKVKMPGPDGELSYSQKLALLMMGDLIKCHHNMAHDIEFNGKDSLLISMVPNLTMSLPLEDYDDYDMYQQNPYVKNVFNGLLYSLEDFAKIKPHELIMTPFLEEVSEELRAEYIELMISASRTIISADAHNSSEEKDWLQYLESGANEKYDEDYTETETGARYLSEEEING